MANTGPSTPNSTPRKSDRSFSTPAKKRIPPAHTTNNATTTPVIGEAAGIETLYTNANGKIIKFSCATSRSRPSSSAGGQHSYPATGTLPWATLTEQTLASGPLEIYRVPGSVSFLHSGSLLHAILPRSNCWCVDGVSKFAMRVLTDTYYRIELPGETEEELAQVEEFKATLKKVLFYERTACPFARTFDVPLPEEQAPRRRRRNTTHGPAKKWKQDRAYSWRPEDGGEPPQLSTSEEESGSLSEEDVDDMERTIGGASSIPEDVEAELEEEVQELRIATPSRPSVRDRVKGLTMRSATAPPQLSLQSTPSSRLCTSESVEGAAYSQITHPTERSILQAIPTEMPPSPPDSSAGFEYTEHSTQHDNDNFNCSNQPRLHIPRLRQHLEEPSSLANTTLEPDVHAATDWQENTAAADTGSASAYARPQDETVFVSADTVKIHALLAEKTNNEPAITEDDCEELLDRVASLPQKPQSPAATAILPDQILSPPPTISAEAIPDTDPFAQIQARIQARRSIGGTTTSGFAPHPRQTSTSTQGASPPSMQRSSSGSTGKTLTHKPSNISRQASQQQQYLATALVKKACAVFLGPPAHLVVLMLRIAARFAKGVFPKSLLYESPRGERRRVPGSFDLNESDDDYGLSDDEESLGDEEWEDDFGVPLNSPVRLSSAAGLRERIRWNLE